MSLPVDWTVFGIVAGIVLVTASAVSKWRGRGLQAVNVMVLGHASSGKTTLMASMFYKLNAGLNGIVVRTDAATTKALRRYSDDMIVGKLPVANRLGDPTRYEFEFAVKAGNGVFRRSFTVVYHDYSGELLTEVDGPNPAFQEAVRDADVLMGILDGEQVYNLMRDEVEPGFLVDLATLMRQLQEGTQPVIHLILTKWDLFEGKYTLADVIDRLDRHLPFEQFHAEGANWDAVVRLIPVSAFGTNGFLVRRDQNIIVDAPQGWRPFMVDTPYACSLADVIDGDLCRLRKKGQVKSANNRRLPRKEISGFFVWAVQILGIVSVSVSLFGVQITGDGKSLAALLANIDTESRGAKRGLHRILRYCLAAEKELVGTFPDSVLYHPGR